MLASDHTGWRCHRIRAWARNRRVFVAPTVRPSAVAASSRERPEKAQRANTSRNGFGRMEAASERAEAISWHNVNFSGVGAEEANALSFALRFRSSKLIQSRRRFRSRIRARHSFMTIRVIHVLNVASPRKFRICRKA